MPFLELGKLIFSFSAEPKIDLLNKGSTGSGSICGSDKFFFPLIEVATDECREMLQAITRQNNVANPYKINFEIIDKPVQGLRFMVTYDHEKVGMTYAIMESTGPISV